jgi:hypothetical protein
MRIDTRIDIGAAQKNFGLFKSTAQGEFAKTRHDYEQAADQAGVDKVVGQVAKRLDTTPEIARALLAQDGWTSKFEASRPAAERNLMAQSGSGGSATFGAHNVAGQTAAKLGGLKDWQPAANDASPWDRDPTAQELAKAQQLTIEPRYLLALERASPTKAFDVGNIQTRKTATGWDVKADVLDAAGGKSGTTSIKLDNDGVVLRSVES